MDTKHLGPATPDGQLSFTPRSLSTSNIRLAFPTSILGSTALTTIQNTFSECYSADVAPSPDFLLVQERGGVVEAAAAITRGPRKFFSETYLDHPGEEVLKAQTGASIARESIVEVGSLAAGPNTNGARLIREIPQRCYYELGAKFIVCTVTARLWRLLRALRLPFRKICDADPNRLPTTDRDRWGTYYEHHPLTCYLDLSAVVANDVERRA